MSEKRILKMVPPNDPRLLSRIAPYQDDMLKEHNFENRKALADAMYDTCLLYTSPSPRDLSTSRMPSSA